MNTVLSVAKPGETARPNSPPSPWGVTPGTVWTSLTVPLRSCLILAVVRSVNTRLPSGRKPTPHGTDSLDAATVAAAWAGAAETVSARAAAASAVIPLRNFIGPPPMQVGVRGKEPKQCRTIHRPSPDGGRKGLK